MRTAIFFAFLVLSVFAFSGVMSQVHGDMAMAGAMSHSIICPFMGGMSPLCTHRAIPDVPIAPTVLALVLIVPFLFVRLAPFAGAQILRTRLRAPPPTLYQELFSSGLLNPKYF